MKIALIIAATVLVVGAGLGLLKVRGAMASGMQKPDQAAKGTLWNLPTQTLAGEATTFEPWQGQVALVVNVASKCGLTPQYEGLEAMYRELKDQGFVVLGFPSNDFMGQEPGTPEEIRAFCDTKYDVTFPLFEKVVVKGDDKCDVYRFLTAGGLEEPSWNFTKYLVGRDGAVIARFGPRTKPDDPELKAAIASALKG